jgi:phospholipid/cholesterol/gamma-HCH transport system permease protein
MRNVKENNITYKLEGEQLVIGGTLTLATIRELLDYFDTALNSYSGKSLTIGLDSLQDADSAGITTLHYIRERLMERDIEVHIEGSSEPLRQKLELFSSSRITRTGSRPEKGFFEGIGASVDHMFRKHISSYLELAADITFWSFTGLFRKRSHRKGEVVNQAIQMGVNAAFIVGTMSFIIGLVLALQSAAQLRTFGANIYIVDLTVIAMMSEMGPLITAILVAGRSGSSIAAEIATMNVTSETDALKTMGLNPVRFVVVPKVHGGILTMPFLTILADVMGILGGLVIAVSYLNISPLVFLHRMEQSLLMKDIVFGVVKSIVFIYLIVITGSYFGFRAEKGASEVGKVTTNAVVVSISLVILADSIMGLLFY